MSGGQGGGAAEGGGSSRPAAGRHDLHRNLVFRLLVLLRTGTLHERTNVLYREAMFAFLGALEPLLEAEDNVTLEERAGLLFVNGSRVPLDAEGLKTARRLTEVFHGRNLSGLSFEKGLSREEVEEFLEVFLEPTGGGGAGAVQGEGDHGLFRRLLRRGVRRIRPIERMVDEEDDGRELDDLSALSRETYFKSIFVAKHLMEQVQERRFTDVRAAKRVVQTIVDLILADETTLLTLVTLREADTTIFRHSVNVSVVAVLLGQRIGLPRSLLGDLGTAALFHDIGLVGQSMEQVLAEEALEGSGGSGSRLHPSMGLRRLVEQGLRSDLMRRVAVTAFEHHRRVDLQDEDGSGPLGDLSLLARIVQVADAYDHLLHPFPGAEDHGAAAGAAEALERLAALSGSVFDAAVVEALAALVRPAVLKAGV